MKTYLNYSIAILALFFSVSILVSGCTKGDTAEDQSSLKDASATTLDELNCNCLVNPSPTITPAEEEMLVYMREEEKLARDVYMHLDGLYDLNVFGNIANSEQRHMDRVLCLLLHYNIEDPASTEPGVFNNDALQQLYNDLTAQGEASLVDALTAGATIEDLDIFDLGENLTQTNNEAIITIFSHLACGSRNHLRAFTTQLTNNGESYTPQFISQEDYDEILASSNERCGNGMGNGSGNGNGNGNCNGTGNGNGGNGNGNGNGNGGNGGNGNGGTCPNNQP